MIYFIYMKYVCEFMCILKLFCLMNYLYNILFILIDTCQYNNLKYTIFIIADIVYLLRKWEMYIGCGCVGQQLYICKLYGTIKILHQLHLQINTTPTNTTNTVIIFRNNQTIYFLHNQQICYISICII